MTITWQYQDPKVPEPWLPVWADPVSCGVSEGCWTLPAGGGGGGGGGEKEVITYWKIKIKSKKEEGREGGTVDKSTLYLVFHSWLSSNFSWITSCSFFSSADNLLCSVNLTKREWEWVSEWVKERKKRVYFTWPVLYLSCIVIRGWLGVEIASFKIAPSLSSLATCSV